VGDIKRYERFIIAAIAVIGIALWTVHRYWYRKKVPPYFVK